MFCPFQVFFPSPLYFFLNEFSLLLGRKFWGFPFFAGNCASGHKAVLNQRSDVAELCSQMIRKLRDVYDPNKKV